MMNLTEDESETFKYMCKKGTFSNTKNLFKLHYDNTFSEDDEYYSSNISGEIIESHLSDFSDECRKKSDETGTEFEDIYTFENFAGYLKTKNIIFEKEKTPYRLFFE